MSQARDLVSAGFIIHTVGSGCLALPVLIGGSSVVRLFALWPHRLFTEEVGVYSKMYVKDADKGLCEEMKANGRLVSKDSIKHRCGFLFRLFSAPSLIA